MFINNGLLVAQFSCDVILNCLLINLRQGFVNCLKIFIWSFLNLMFKIPNIFFKSQRNIIPPTNKYSTQKIQSNDIFFIYTSRNKDNE